MGKPRGRPPHVCGKFSISNHSNCIFCRLIVTQRARKLLSGCRVCGKPRRYNAAARRWLCGCSQQED